MCVCMCLCVCVCVCVCVYVIIVIDKRGVQLENTMFVYLSAVAFNNLYIFEKKTIYIYLEGGYTFFLFRSNVLYKLLCRYMVVSQ